MGSSREARRVSDFRGNLGLALFRRLRLGCILLLSCFLFLLNGLIQPNDGRVDDSQHFSFPSRLARPVLRMVCCHSRPLYVVDEALCFRQSLYDRECYLLRFRVLFLSCLWRLAGLQKRPIYIQPRTADSIPPVQQRLFVSVSG